MKKEAACCRYLSCCEFVSLWLWSQSAKCKLGNSDFRAWWYQDKLFMLIMNKGSGETCGTPLDAVVATLHANA